MAKCTLCNVEKTKAGTTNLEVHLRNHHKKAFQDLEEMKRTGKQYNQQLNKTSTASRQIPMTNFVVPNKIKQLRYKVAAMVALDGTPPH